MGMENMYRMRAAHKEMQEEEKTAHPVTEEAMELGEYDRTLAEILGDRDEQDKFLNKFLWAKDPDKAKDIVDSLAENTVLSPEQDKFLEQARVEFNLRSAEIEQVQEMLPAELVHLKDIDPRIAQVIGKVGPDEAAEVLGAEFADLALSDPKVFKKMVGQMRHLREIRTSKEAAQREEDLTHMLAEFGIKEEDYWNATRSSAGMTSGVTGETRDQLGKLVFDNYGWFKKTLDVISSGHFSANATRDLVANFEDQQRLLAECDKHMKVVGKVLQGTLTPEVRLMFQKAMTEGGLVKDKKVENNVKTIQDYRQVKNAFEPADMQKRWEEYKRAELKRRNITDITKQPVAAENIKNSFAQKELDQQKGFRAGGILAALIALLFGTKDDIKNTLKF